MIGGEGGEGGGSLVAKSVFLVLHYFFFLSFFITFSSPKDGPTFIILKNTDNKKKIMYRLRRYIEYWVFIQAGWDVLTCIKEGTNKKRQQMEEKLHVEKKRRESKYYVFYTIAPSTNMPLQFTVY